MHDINTRRDRHQIVAEILETARGGTLRTHILFKARLSYEQLSEYLPLLVEKGFLENLTIVRNRQIKHLLRTTKQGEHFLQSFRALDL